VASCAVKRSYRNTGFFWKLSLTLPSPESPRKSVLLPLSHLLAFSRVSSWSCDPPEAENLDRNCNKVDSFNCRLCR